MHINFSKKFVKQLSKQSEKVQKAFYVRLELFEENPYHELLRNHQLTGELKGLSSIRVTGDVRALYEIIDDEIYLYQMIGTHSQFYG